MPGNRRDSPDRHAPIASQEESMRSTTRQSRRLAAIGALTSLTAGVGTVVATPASAYTNV